MKSNDIFSFLRGAIRGAFGKEDFNDKTFLLVGCNQIGLELLTAIFSAGEILLFFTAEKNKIKDYLEIIKRFPDALSWKGEPIDVVINLNEGFLKIKGREVLFKDIQEDYYTRGIHSFYLK